MNEFDTTLYQSIKSVLDVARAKVYAEINFAMVEAYWNIGRLIVEKQGGEERADYGSSLINELSKRLTADFGKGFTPTNLKYMRQFYLLFQNRHALRDQLSMRATTRRLVLCCVRTKASRWLSTNYRRKIHRYILPNISYTYQPRKNCGKKLNTNET